MSKFNYQAGIPGVGRKAGSSVELIVMLISQLLRMAFFCVKGFIKLIF